MTEMLSGSAFIGVLISLAMYELGLLLKKKLKLSIVNPLLIAIAGTIVFLLVTKVPYDSYSASAAPLSYLLTPATVCLSIPLYRQLELLRRSWKAIIIGITLGVIMNLVSILLLALIFSLSHSEYATLLPKSITTAIGMHVSAENGGISTITVAVIVMTGITGNILAEPLCRLLRITEPVAQGVAIGTSSHAIGTSRAMEMDPVAGAMSGIAIAVAGLISVAGIAVFARFI